MYTSIVTIYESVIIFMYVLQETVHVKSVLFYSQQSSIQNAWILAEVCWRIHLLRWFFIVVSSTLCTHWAIVFLSTLYLPPAQNFEQNQNVLAEGSFRSRQTILL